MMRLPQNLRQFKIMRKLNIKNIEITTDLLNSILEKDLLGDKIGILDIRTKEDNDTDINIEMLVE